MFSKTVKLLLAVSVSSVHAQYPSTYPFDNEVIVPPEIPHAVPTFQFDETDAGGYNWHFGILLTKFDGTLTEDDCDQSKGGYCPGINDSMMYMNVVMLEIPPVDPIEIFNCSGLGNVYVESDFSGVIAGKTICNPGECCSELIGKGSFVEEVDTEQFLTDKIKSNACAGELVEDLYCLMAGADWALYCVDYWLHPTERFVVQTCYDVAYRFYMDCRTLAIEFTILYKKEPAHYYASCTNEQMMSSDTFANAQDRVCNPYSYYFPTAAQDAVSSSLSNTSGDVSSAAHSLPVLLLVLIAVVF